MYITDNPIADYDRHLAEEQAYIDRLPKCDVCGEPIHEYVYEIDGKKICEECLKENYRHDVEEYMNDEEYYEED